MSPKLGEVLISHRALDEEKLLAALSDQRAFGGKLGRTLVDLGYVTEDQLLRALSEQLALDTVDLDTADVHEEALRCLPVDVCERYGVFPVRVDSRQRILWVATAEPDRESLQELAQIAQHTLEPMLASMSSIDRAVRRYYFGERTGPAPRLGEPLRATADVSPPPLSRPRPAAESGPPRAAAAPPSLGPIVPDGPAHDAMQELRTLLIRVEKEVTAQSRAFRALVELLQEKGIVRRGELGQKAAKK
jgi:type IV pilus assembly protein PilB